MARSIKEDEKIHLTEYVVTRYYRAPEVMLSSHQYTKSIDIWSAGCTFAELLSKNFLFPGDNYIQQVKLIIELLGSPNLNDIKFIQNEQAKNYVISLKNVPKKSFKEAIGDYDENALDLLEKMIVFNPEKRISAESSLSHPYISSIKDPEVEDPIFEGTLNFEFD
jgi:serine/threonine protein kinase